VEDPCEHGDEPSGSIKCWEGCTIGSFSRRAQLHKQAKVKLSSLISGSHKYSLSSLEEAVRFMGKPENAVSASLKTSTPKHYIFSWTLHKTP
jgi:hypothetical protein